MTTGSTAWGHSTSNSTNTRTFAGNWTGTGTISGSGDEEVINLNMGEYMTSEIVNTGATDVYLRQNFYDTSGDDVTLYYRTAATEGGITSATWTEYTAQFTSLGYVQVKLQAPGGLLSVSTTNPHYFVDNNGNQVILAGSHIWNNLQEVGTTDPPTGTDYDTWLEFIETRGHNIFRLWCWEQSRYVCEIASDNIFIAPNVYNRSATSGNNDGGNKFDLDSFNQAYFDRLRARVVAAGRRNMYAIIMLFDGWSVDSKALWGGGQRYPFLCHPFHASNNVNSIDGDTNDDNEGIETQSNSIPAVTTYQKAYVAKVIDTVNDLNNVLYEVCNEGGNESWTEEIINYIHTYEAGKSFQHLVGCNEGTWPDSWIETSGADWVSYALYDPDMDAPPEWDVAMPQILDSDHNGGIVYGWNPFRHFCQGNGGILLMDEYDATYASGYSDVRANVSTEYTRYNLGYVLDYAARMDVLNCSPQSALCSTGYCIRKANTHYLCYQPSSGNFTLNLTEASGTFNIEWLKCSDGTVTSGGTTTGGAIRTLTPPGTDYVAYVYK